MNQPLVSIVVTTKNEAKNIANCLESIRLQTYQPLETIVVDNQSTDDTKAIAGRYTDKVFDKGPERSAQRNFGMIEKSQGTYVMFVDADMLLSQNLVERAVQFMEANADVSALHISEVVLGKRYFSRVRRFERVFYDGTVIDGARFFRKDTFVQVGGFDESMSGPEDWDLDKKIKRKGRIALLPKGESITAWNLSAFIQERGVDPLQHGSVIYHNEAEFDLKKYLSKKGYYAKSFEGYTQKWGANDPDLQKQLGAYYRFVGVFTEAGHWKRLLKHPVLVFGMYFLRFSVGLTFVVRKMVR